MNTTVFSENLKRFRISKQMTQEDVANYLCVNTQTVSRWECATTLPDVMTLPHLAKLYGVTIDDFYRKHSVAYSNYAQRLSSVYEKTRDPEDFIQCFFEYKKLIKNGNTSMEDKWNYATIHHFMMRYCIDTALEWYDKAIADGPEKDIHVFRRARSLRTQLLNEIGRIDEVINQQEQKCETYPEDPLEWQFLVETYLFAKDYQKAFNVFQQSVKKFPDNWVLYIYGGEIYKHLLKYDEAFKCWDKAGEIGTYFYDELYCKASCYNDMGEYEKAYEMYKDIAEKLREDNNDVEAVMAEEEANRIKAKIV